MPDIDKALFAGKEIITSVEWATLTTPDMGEMAVGEFLEGIGWDGKAAGVVGIQLAVDNSRPSAARFALAGQWRAHPDHIQAQKVFAEAPADWILEINLPNMSVFQFPDGRMASKYLGGDAVEYRFYKVEDSVKRFIDDDELGQHGISYFSVRAICSLAKTCNVKWGIWVTTTILIYPESEEGMLAVSPAASHAAWPGIKLAEGDVAVLPAAGRGKAALNGKAWGCPLAPAIQVGSDWADAPGPLKAADVRAAVGALLGEGVLADCSLNEESLKRKWTKIQRAPDALKPRKPEKTWPTMAANIAAVAKTGKSKNYTCTV
jgi:hypothetical protein